METPATGTLSADYSVAEAQLSFLAHDGYVEPEYPRKARVLGLEGVLRISLAVQDGSLVTTQIVQSSGHEILDAAGLTAIQQWRFRKISATFVQQIRFQLQ